jgi:hypothetical protein
MIDWLIFNILDISDWLRPWLANSITLFLRHSKLLFTGKLYENDNVVAFGVGDKVLHDFTMV